MELELPRLAHGRPFALVRCNDSLGRRSISWTFRLGQAPRKPEQTEKFLDSCAIFGSFGVRRIHIGDASQYLTINCLRRLRSREKAEEIELCLHAEPFNAVEQRAIIAKPILSIPVPSEAPMNRLVNQRARSDDCVRDPSALRVE